MNLNEAKKILSENNYEVINKQQVNEWVTPMRFSYIIKFGQIQGAGRRPSSLWPGPPGGRSPAGRSGPTISFGERIC